jgi:hypothetical protein
MDRPLTCQQCGKPLPDSSKTGRTRRYCGATCRSAARRQRSREAGRAGEDPKDVQVSLTSPHGKAKLDNVVGESGVSLADSPAETGRAAARGLLERWRSAESGTPLDTIAIVQGAAGAIDEGMREAVQRARGAGNTWAEIGQVLGTTRQAAFQRFGRPADPRTRLPMARPVWPGAAANPLPQLADDRADRGHEPSFA